LLIVRGGCRRLVIGRLVLAEEGRTIELGLAAQQEHHHGQDHGQGEPGNHQPR